jgi:hypothetical protein
MSGIGTLALVATAIIAALVAYSQIRQARESRHAETFTAVLQRWNDSPFRDVRMKIRTYVGAAGSKGLMDKMLELRNAPDKEYWQLLAAGDFFEDVAMLVNYRAISMDMADRRFGHKVCEYWSMLKPFVIWYRETNDNPTWLEQFENLAAKISVMHGWPFPWVFPDGWGAGVHRTPGGWREPTKE